MQSVDSDHEVASLAMDYLSVAWTTIYYVAYPIFYILQFILFVFVTTTAPLLHLGHYCFCAYWYALRVMENFEASQTLYIFLGIAALVGFVTGTSLHYFSCFIISVLNLDSSPGEQRGRTLAAYRADKQERRDAQDPSMKLRPDAEGFRSNDLGLMEDYTKWNASEQDRGRGVSRIIDTILEEEDSSDAF